MKFLKKPQNFFLSNPACALLPHVTQAGESPGAFIYLKAVYARKVKL